MTRRIFAGGTTLPTRPKTICSVCTPHKPGDPVDTGVSHGLCEEHARAFEVMTDEATQADGRE